LNRLAAKKFVNEIKTAKHYYDKNIGSNFTKLLGSLVKNKKLLEISTDKYALAADTKSDLERILA
jgi:hypothetical protein